MLKKMISFLKNTRFSGKGCFACICTQNHIYTAVNVLYASYGMICLVGFLHVSIHYGSLHHSHFTPKVAKEMSLIVVMCTCLSSGEYVHE